VTKIKQSIDETSLQEAGISESDVGLLVAFAASEEWKILLKLMKSFNAKNEMMLRNPTSTLDWMRVAQGRIGQLNELANMISLDLPEWHNAPASKKAGRNA
jgi:hypothetical protein